MVKENKINYFAFCGVLFIGYILGLFFPDIDQGFQDLLGHRSIITHSILLPYLLLYYFIKKKNNPNVLITIFVIGIFLGIGLHLSADLHPKSFKGYALIKLPGNIDVGGLSPIWIAANAAASLYFAGLLLNKTTHKKLFWISYLVIAFLIGMTYAGEERHNEEVIAFTFIILLFATFFISRKLNKTKIIEAKRPEKKEKKNKKKSGNMKAIIVAVVLVSVFGFLIFFLANPQKTSERKIQQEKQSNYRAYDIYKDEFNICKNKITRKYSKKNFSEFSWVNYSAPKNQKRYTKKIIMTMKHDGLILKNKYFGKVDCFIVVQSDQSITFGRLGNKYK
jgi:hypothetical protein